jgi:hypothetical protein
MQATTTTTRAANLAGRTPAHGVPQSGQGSETLRMYSLQSRQM